MSNEFHCANNWHNRGYLPHYDAERKIQFITYRLSDSLPKATKAKLKENPYEDLSEADKEKRRDLIDSTLDKGFGSCILKDSSCAKIIVDAWKFFDNERYDLIAYVVMPNHVHLLIKTKEKYSVGSLVKSWKVYTSKEIRKLYAKNLTDAECNSALPLIIKPGQAFWQREYWDRFIRDDVHFKKSIEYIFNNPVKAGLCKSIFEWQWSNASTYFESKK